jgi:hypothetical protein
VPPLLSWTALFNRPVTSEAMFNTLQCLKMGREELARLTARETGPEAYIGQKVVCQHLYLIVCHHLYLICLYNFVFLFLQLMETIIILFRMALTRPRLREWINQNMPQLTIGPMEHSCGVLQHSDVFSAANQDIVKGRMEGENFSADSHALRYVF